MAGTRRRAAYNADMRYLLNLLLGLAALLQARIAYLALMPGPWPGWGDGPSRGAMAYIMLEAALFSWRPLVIAGLGAIAAVGGTIAPFVVMAWLAWLIN